MEGDGGGGGFVNNAGKKKNWLIADALETNSGTNSGTNSSCNSNLDI